MRARHGSATRTQKLKAAVKAKPLRADALPDEWDLRWLMNSAELTKFGRVLPAGVGSFRLEWLPLGGDPQPFAKLTEHADQGVSITSNGSTWMLTARRRAWWFTLRDHATGETVAAVKRRGLPRRLWVDSSTTGELLCLRENGSPKSYAATLDDEEVWSIVAADGDADDAAVFFFERGTRAAEEPVDWLLPLLVWLTWRASIVDRASRGSGFSILDLIFPS
jgi:hypothetical protein